MSVAKAKTVQPMFILKAKLLSHNRDTEYAKGQAIRLDKITHFKKFFVSRSTIPDVEAPTTFLMPISFVLCSAVNDASPKSPRHEIKIVKTVKYLMIDPKRNSEL